MGALEGICVIAIEQAVAAPLCTLRLADAGARVIKIERPEGETARNYDSTVHGTSAYFAWLNRGKESAVLDLKSPGDMALLTRMLSHADILVQNLAPGAMGRLGLSDEVLRARFPQLIAVSIVGYGQDTDYAQMRAYDMLVQAEAGLCAVTGPADTPSKVGVSVADIATGGNAYAAILEALIQRSKTGQGAAIEISMFDGLADWMAVPLLHYDYAGKTTKRHGLSHASIYPYRPFECRDGTIIIAVQNNAEWEKLCRDALNMPELCERPEFSSNADRVAHRDALDQSLEPIFAQLTLAEAQTLCSDAGIAWAHYSSVADLSEHPALRRMEITLPDGQSAQLPRPAGFKASTNSPRVPGLGQHTDTIRQEFSQPNKPQN